MLKVKKLVLVLIGMMVISFCLGCVSSYAAEENVTTITANTSRTTRITNTTTNTDNTNTNTNLNTNTNTSNTNTNTIGNTNTSSNYSNTNSNTSTNKSSLPYTGTKSTIVFVVIAFGVSAIYAYRKVREYKNI